MPQVQRARNFFVTLPKNDESHMPGRDAFGIDLELFEETVANDVPTTPKKVPTTPKKVSPPTSPKTPYTLKTLKNSTNPICNLVYDRLTTTVWPIMSVNLRRLAADSYSKELIAKMSDDFPMLVRDRLTISCPNKRVFRADVFEFLDPNWLYTMQVDVTLDHDDLAARLRAHDVAFVFCVMHDPYLGHATFARVRRDLHSTDTKAIVWTQHDPNGTTSKPVELAQRKGIQIALDELKRLGHVSSYRIEFAREYEVNLKAAVTRYDNRLHPLVQWRDLDENVAMCVFFSVAMLIDHMCVPRMGNGIGNFTNASFVRRVFRASPNASDNEKQVVAVAFIMTIFSELVRRYLPRLAMQHTHDFDVKRVQCVKPKHDRRKSI